MYLHTVVIIKKRRKVWGLNLSGHPGWLYNTVTKLLIDTGKACQNFHDENVHGLNSTRIEADEIWSFVYSKQKSIENNVADVEGAGDVWTWTAIDADSKMIVSWFVGDRNEEAAYTFMCDIKSRLKNRVQLTTDGHKAYLNAVPDAFGSRIDYYAMLIKIYGEPAGANTTERKYSPGDCTGFEKKRILGKPLAENVSTSYVERQNLTMRMHMRRFTRLTNAFSKKMENHCHAMALHFVYYNFAKIHKTLRVTPAMEAGLTKDVMTIEDIVRLTIVFMGIRVIVSEPEKWNLGNLFGEIVSERRNTLRVKLSRTLKATDFSSDVIIFYSDDLKSFRGLSQQYAVFVSGYLVDKNNNLSELILKGTISYD